MPTPERQTIFFLATALISAAFYIFIGYVVCRYETIPLLVSYTFLFAAYLMMCRQGGALGQPAVIEFKRLVYLAIGLRITLLFAIPHLSDDFYRFIWDGRLLVAGINPFAELPAYYKGQSVAGLTSELFENLNSPEYFTIYPPINQLIFWIAALVTGDSVFGSVLVMRLFILTAEIGTVFLMPRVLAQFGLSKSQSLLYLLNPLVILEVSGNLHFEGMMVFFILLALWWLNKRQLPLSAGAIGLAVGTKLIPLIFLPFLPRPLNLKNTAVYYSVCALTIVVLFLPLLSVELVRGIQSSLSLYYQKFEFNASIYFILREIGFHEFGYNRIEYIGKDLVKYTFWSIMILAFWPWGRKPKLPTLFMFALGIYLLFSTTVHPWYIVTLLALSVFGNYKSPLLWSFLVFFTYAGYSQSGFQLPCWILFVEYGLVILLFIYELNREAGLIKLIKSKLNG